MYIHNRTKTDPKPRKKILHRKGGSLSESNEKMGKIGKIFRRFKKPKNIDEYLTVVHFSDIHGRIPSKSLPEGDILIFSGDFSKFDDWDDYLNCQSNHNSSPCRKFDEFMKSQPHKVKIMVAGNHDRLDMVEEVQNEHFQSCEYLSDDFTIVDVPQIFPEKKYSEKWSKIKIYGSARNHHVKMAFGTTDLKSYWKDIPVDTNILVTHIPIFNCMDLASVNTYNKAHCKHCGISHPSRNHWGSKNLRLRIEELVPHKLLKLHCYGHVHEFNGIVYDEKNDLTYMNACPVMMSTQPLVYYLNLMEVD